MALRQLVSDAPAAGVQHDPDRVALVEAHLEEVVSRAERAELRRGLRLLLRAQLHAVAVGLHPLVRHTRRPAVAPTDAGRNHRAERADERVEVVRQLRCGEAGLHGDHSAADVDTDSRRNHRILSRNDRTNRRAHADVGIGHQRDVAGDDRQPAGLSGLNQRSLVDVARPVPQRGAHLRRHGLSLFVVAGAQRIELFRRRSSRSADEPQPRPLEEAYPLQIKGIAALPGGALGAAIGQRQPTRRGGPSESFVQSRPVHVGDGRSSDALPARGFRRRREQVALQVGELTQVDGAAAVVIPVPPWWSCPGVKNRYQLAVLVLEGLQAAGGALPGHAGRER